MALRDDLKILGFAFADRDVSGATFYLEMAVREFQRYASLETVAVDPGTAGQPIWKRLNPQSTGTQRYDGPINGDSNDQKTLNLINYWKTNNWRCPIVVLAATQSKTGISVVKENLWLRDEFRTSAGVKIYVRDLTGLYFQDTGAPIIVGQFQTNAASGGGPVSLPATQKKTPRGAIQRITPDLLLGHALKPEEKSTYLVLRAVSQCECLGYFDCLNGWDDVFVSLGLFHWALGAISTGKLQAGELGGYFAYLRKFEPDGYNAVCARWGIDTALQWGDDGSALFNDDQRKYATGIVELAPGGTNKRIQSREEANFLRSWQWFYRLEAASRFHSGVQQRMWDMGRIRLRDVLGAEFPGELKLQVRENGTLRPATLADVYTSELCIAWLLRWHVKRPSHIISNGEVGPKVIQALLDAKLPGGIVNDWPADAQNCLREKLRIRAIAILGEDVGTVAKYRDTDLSVSLSTEPKSFAFFEQGLPPAPWRKKKAIVEYHKEPTAATEARRAVGGHSNGTLLYEAIATQTPIKSITERYFDGSHWHDGAPPAGIRTSIDELRFYDDQGLIVALPILSKELSVLQTNDAGTNKATLRIQGRVRCLVNQADGDSAEFQFVIDGSSFVRLQNFELDLGPSTSAPQRRGKIAAPTPLTRAGLMSGASISIDIAGGSLLPNVATRLGLEGFGTDDKVVKQFRLSFVDAKPDSSDDPALSLHMLQQFLLIGEPTAQKLSSFALEFKSTDMPPEGEVGNWTQLIQRQPEGRAKPRALPDAALWLLEIAVPQNARLSSSDSLPPEAVHQVLIDGFSRLAVIPVDKALTTIHAGQPVSFIPELTDGTQGTIVAIWTALFAVLDRSSNKDLDFDVVWPGDPLLKSLRGNDETALVVPRILYPDDTVLTDAHGNPVNRFAAAKFPRVATLEDQPLTCRFRVFQPEQTLREDFSDRDLNFAPSILFHVEQVNPLPADSRNKSTPKKPKIQIVRIGALDVVLIPDVGRPNQPYKPDIPNFNSDYRESRLVLGLSGNDRGEAIGATLRTANFDLALTGLAPGGQDDTPGDQPEADPAFDPGEDPNYEAAFERTPALVLTDTIGSDGSADAAWTAVFRLRVLENMGPSSSQSIHLQLHSGGAAPPGNENRNALVLDPEPFLIAAVRADDFETDLAAILTTEIGNWSNQTTGSAGWSLAQTTKGFPLFLPPQGVGEAMHRRIGSGDIQPGEPIDFRFTPNTTMVLSPSYFDRRYGEPPWNLRRVLGYVGQRSPGADVKSLEYELLYGMYGRITTPDLRICEVEPRIGRMAGRQGRSLPWLHDDKTEEVFERSRQVWSTLRHVASRRLAALEPWRNFNDRELRVKQSDGLTYEIRIKASNASLRNPTPEGDIPDGVFVSSGLAGGWSWPFESANILNAVLRNRLSTDASVSRLAFSALGGWGNEKASFDRGLTTIYTEVVMGRLASVTLERIGRISVFWNRAKHVIVYGRSVAASRQFFLEQEPLLGNPVLRKVDEYVELLEADRAFPDSTAPDHSRGPVLGSFFPGKPPRINVNSRWGKDIGKSGWKVPLWLRGAAPEDVYPKPHVILKMAGESSAVVTPCSLYDPEKLYFYTSTDENLSPDTNLWPPVEGVDFDFVQEDPKSPGMATLQQPLEPAPAQPQEFKSPDVPIKPGTGAFTFRLEPSAGSVNLVADRTTTAVMTRLHNFTAMRSVALFNSSNANRQPQPIDVNLRKALEVRDHLSNAISPAQADLSSGHDIAAVLADLQTNAATYTDALSTVSVPVESICDEIAQRVTRQFQVARVGIEAEMQAVITGALAKLNTEVENARAEFPDPHAAAEALLAGAQEIVDDANDVLQAIHGSAAEARQLIDDAIDRLNGASDRAQQIIQQGFCPACHPTGSVLGPEHATEIDALRDAAVDAFREAEFVIGEAVRQWSGDRLNRAALNFRSFALVTDPSSQGPPLTFDGAFRVLAIMCRNGTLQVDVFDQALKEMLQGLDLAAAKAVSVMKNGKDGWEDLLPQPETQELASDVLTRVANAINQAGDDWDKFDFALNDQLRFYLSTLANQIAAQLDQVQKDIPVSIKSICNTILPSGADLLSYLQQQVGAEPFRRLISHLSELGADARDFVAAELDRFYSSAASELNHFLERVRAALPAVDPALLPIASFQLIRGFGDAPALPQLEFNLPQCGFYFFDFPGIQLPPQLIPQVDLTPIAARANRILEEGTQFLRDRLNSLDIHIPTTSLFDRLLPATSLPQFDLSSIFPNVAGLNLQNLFSGIKIPSEASDHIKVTHGVDAAARTAWLEADINFGMSQPATVFSMAAVSLRLLTAHFEGVCRIESTAGQPPRRIARGSITGDWEIIIGGVSIAQLVSCRLHFEEGGHVGFDITPDRVRLQQALAFLSDLLSSISSSDGGFSFAVTATGVRTALHLPLPDIESGVFGIANLSLGFFFELSFAPSGGSTTFVISTGLNVASRMAPFSLTIFILGGAGFLESRLSYQPDNGALEASIAIGIFAEASLAIALGPIHGGIYAYVGITVDCHTSNRAPGATAITLLILFRGEVSLLGLISVSLCLSLAAQYGSGGQLTGTGRVSYSIKIGWFFSIDVSADVSYTFGSAGGRTAALRSTNRDHYNLAFVDDPYTEAAEQYVLMFQD